jgi:hypothetical protein
MKKGIIAAALTGSVLIGASLVPEEPQEKNEFVPITWNANQRENGDGTITTNIHQKFVNYVDDGKWKKTSLEPARTSSGFVFSELPYKLFAPATADGDFVFTADNPYSVKEGKMRDDAPISKKRSFVSVRPVPGVQTDEGILYEDALPDVGASLLIQPHEQEARYLIKWDSAPTCEGSLEVGFIQEAGVAPRKNDGQEIGKKSIKTKDGFSFSVNEFRSISTGKTFIWDAKNNELPVELSLSYVHGKILGKKIIPCDFFDTATFPVYADDTDTFLPDPNPETNTFDGRVGNSGAVWATVRGATTGSYLTGDTANIISTTSQESVGLYYIVRSIMLFNTGPTIAANRNITSAKITLTADLVFDGGGTQGYAVVTGPSNPASNTGIANGDFDVTGDNAHSDNQDLTGWTAGGTRDFTLNAAGIANIAKGSGVSKFGLRDGYDFESVTPGAGFQSGVDVRSADYAGTGSDPVLSVTHVPAESPRPKIITIE